LYSDRSDIEIRVLENGGNDGTTLVLNEYALQLRSKPLRLNIRKIKPNIGFGPGFNKLADGALGDILFFVSNDVRIFGDFITRVMYNLDTDDYAIVCHELNNFPTGWNQFGGQMIPYPAGHFFACTKKLWIETIGGFDERFVPHDYEDVDLGMAAGKLEIPMIGMPMLPIEHMVAGTIGYSPERMENTVLQRKRFAEKWGLPNVPERP
jgi:GT2 family glycosyltransferase